MKKKSQNLPLCDSHHDTVRLRLCPTSSGSQKRGHFAQLLLLGQDLILLSDCNSGICRLACDYAQIAHALLVNSTLEATMIFRMKCRVCGYILGK